MQRSDLRTGCALLVRPDGGVDLASTAGQAWLEEPPHRVWIAEIVDAIEATSQPEGTVRRGKFELKWRRLDGPHHYRYLVQIQEPRDLTGPFDALSPAQRRVAEYLAAGATAAETAATLGLHVETVRSHVKAIYRRLGISGRAELARALVSAGPPAARPPQKTPEPRG